MKYILITGVSTGIGYATAKYFLERGYFVFGSVRKKSDGDRLLKDFASNFKPLIFDVTNDEAIQNAVLEVQHIVGDNGLAGLVNNAGIAVSGPMQHVPIEKLEYQLNVNVLGVVRVTQAFLPLLGAVENSTFPPGRIIQISSVSGTISAPFMGPYSASKYALEAISDALRRELSIFNIKVVVIQPGPIQSDIWDKIISADDYYPDTSYAPILAKRKKGIAKTGENAIPAIRVAEKIWAGMELKNPKTRYLVDKAAWKMKVYQKLPDKILDNAVTKPFKKILNRSK